MIHMLSDYAGSWSKPVQEKTSSWKEREVCPVASNHKGGFEAGTSGFGGLQEIAAVFLAATAFLYGAVNGLMESYTFMIGPGPMILAASAAVAIPVTLWFFSQVSR